MAHTLCDDVDTSWASTEPAALDTRLVMEHTNPREELKIFLSLYQETVFIVSKKQLVYFITWYVDPMKFNAGPSSATLTQHWAA